VSEAVAGADVVAVATNAHEPVLVGELLEEGQHVGSVQVRELDASVLECVRAASVDHEAPATRGELARKRKP
jgi:ornithine cyclodeaminase/alanine dehydrogenase-like protein (mu-crystallin family)